jgi:hypothetical protein
MSTESKSYAQLVVAFAPLLAMIVLIGWCLRRETQRAEQVEEMRAERQAFWDDVDRYARSREYDLVDQSSVSASLDRIWETEGPDR